MSEKSPKRSFWLTVESIAIAVFFIFFISWSMQKCNEESYLRQNTSNKFHLERARDSMAKANRENRVIEENPAEEEVSDSKANTETEITEKKEEIKPPIEEKKTKPEPAKQSFKVIADGTNLRKRPALDARSLGKLKRNEMVTFLNESVREKQKIKSGKMGNSNVQYWYKVKTRNGSIGWIYGTGIKR